MAESEGVKLGLVASLSKATGCFLIFEEGPELDNSVREEDFVIIKDKRTNSLVLGIIRNGRGIDPMLKTGTYGVGTAFVSKGKGDLLSTHRMFFDSEVIIIGEIRDGKIQPNRKWITPGSWARIPNKNPFAYFEADGKKMMEIGHARDHPDWRMRLIAKDITRHMAIFGSTGSGKSHLVREELIPEILNTTDYSVLVFDYNGEDFAAHAKEHGYRVISVKEIKLDVGEVVTDILARCKNFGQWKRGGPIELALENAVEALFEKKGGDHYEDLKSGALTYIRANNRQDYAESYSRKFENFYNKLEPDSIKDLFDRKYEPENIDEDLKKNRVIVVDLSDELPGRRVTIATAILKYYLEQMKKDEKGGLKKLNRVVVLDEAPQYCPYVKYNDDPRVKEAQETISSLLALGRKHELGMVLMAQGMKGTIGIEAGIRRNINTKIVGKISPSDLDEAETDVLRGKVSSDVITNLQLGEFYISGIMSPVDQPVLVQIFASKEEKYEGRSKGK